MTQFYSLSKNKCYWGCIFPEWHLVFCSSQLTGLSKLLTWKNHNQQRTMTSASPPKCCIACLTSVSPLGGNMVGKGHWTSSLVCSPQGLAHWRKAKGMMVELIKELIMELIFPPWSYHNMIMRLQLYVIAHKILFHFSKLVQCFIILYVQKEFFCCCC